MSRPSLSLLGCLGNFSPSLIRPLLLICTFEWKRVVRNIDIDDITKRCDSVKLLSSRCRLSEVCGGYQGAVSSHEELGEICGYLREKIIFVIVIYKHVLISQPASACSNEQLSVNKSNDSPLKRTTFRPWASKALYLE